MAATFAFPVHFIWDMAPEEFRALHVPITDVETPYDYNGAVFFGNFKLEFIQNDHPDGYRNLFLLGREGYDWLKDGTPYDELINEEESIAAPYRRTFAAFADNVERQIIRLLADHPEYTHAATAPTDPNKWYPEQPYDINHISRETIRYIRSDN